MLLTGTRIQIRRDGSSKEIERLMISDIVYCPLSDKLVEIVDILSRTVEIAESKDDNEENWAPVLVPQHAISRGCPKAPLYVSPRQQIFVFQQEDACATNVKSVGLVSAIDKFSRNSGNKKFATFHAIFLDHARPIVANGALCMCYGPELFSKSLDLKAQMINRDFQHIGGQ